jgi:hypothetical protein
MSLIDNERTKLLANALDRASTACFTVGILTPAAGYLYNIGNSAVLWISRRYSAVLSVGFLQ